MGPRPRRGLAEMIRAINTGDPEMRVAAIQTLESIGPEAKPAVPALIAALSHEDPRVQRAAAEALGPRQFRRGQADKPRRPCAGPWIAPTPKSAARPATPC